VSYSGSTFFTVRWLFVIGVALEIGGALLISLPLILPVLRRQWMSLSPRGLAHARRGPTEIDVDEFAYALVGGVFLLVGFTLQLAGYVDEFKHHWAVLAGVGAGVAVGCLLLGEFLLAPRLSRWLLEKASGND
jgi:hypothetical protein